MRYFLIILEKLGKERAYEILDSTTDESEAVNKLMTLSDQWEHAIVSGQCKVYMTTYIEK